MTTEAAAPPDGRPRVGLFVTCLVDLFRPNIGFAAVKLLEDAGCEVHVPEAQICCGQPAYNSGDLENTRAIARQVIEAFAGFDYVVAPSGSCLAMLEEHYPALFSADAGWHARAEDLAGRCHELTGFLHDTLGIHRLDGRCEARVTYHDACSGLRELGVAAQPRALLRSLAGVEIRELEETEACCGFGGTFCVKYPAISERLVASKVADIEATGAELVLAGDLGCLLNIAGRLRREGSAVRVYHVAEVLAGMTGLPAIGEGAGRG